MSSLSSSSSHTQVPLLFPTELLDSVLGGAAELVVERGARSRCFLHIHSEEERQTAVKATTDEGDATRRAHVRWLDDLQWAREIMWSEPRIRRFVRYANHLVWPAQTQVSKVAAVVRQLMLCDEDDNAAALAKANDVARATQILEREATQPGLHLLTESTIPGQAVLYEVVQSRKRERDAAASSMPSVLTRVEDATVDAAAWIAEVKQITHSVSGVLTLQFTAAALTRLVELLKAPSSSSLSPSPSSSPQNAVRQQWKALVDQHRTWAEYQSLFADVAEMRRSWGASETCVAEKVNAAVEAKRCVHLRTGVHMSVVHRTQLLLLLSVRPRKLESLTTAEQQAVAAVLPSHSWAECLDAGLVRLIQPPAGDVTPAALETTIRRLFLSPALSAIPLTACCTMSEPRVVHGDLQLVLLTAPVNPYVVVHGSRVDGGFEGDVPYYEGLQRERDRLVEERMDEQLRRSVAEGPTTGRTGQSAASSAAAVPAKRQLSHMANKEASTYLFTRALVATLTSAPLSKAEIQQHPSMQQFRGEGNFEAMLNTKLKEIAEYKGRRYQLRN